MILKAFLFIIVALLVIILLKSFNSSFSKFIAIICGSAIIVFASGQLVPVFDFIRMIANITSINNDHLNIIFKCTAVCLLGNFASHICSDSNEGTLAYGADLLSRCIIISISLPIYTDVFNWMIKIWEKV